MRERERDEDGGEMCGTEIGVCHMGRLGLVRGKQKKHLGEIVEEWACVTCGEEWEVWVRTKQNKTKTPVKEAFLAAVTPQHLDTAHVKLRDASEKSWGGGGETRLKNGSKTGSKTGSNPVQTRFKPGANPAQTRLKHGSNTAQTRAPTRLKQGSNKGEVCV